MAAMAALQSSMTSFSLSSNSFIGQRLSVPPLFYFPVKPRENPCPIVVKIEAPIHSPNVMLYSKEQDVTSRVGHKVLDNGKKVRYLVKTGEIIDSNENWKKLKEAVREKTEVAAAAS
ncbi:hypothetical protein CRYUN_Cryun25bG0020800 [Craigia yunnanensis]